MLVCRPKALGSAVRGFAYLVECGQRRLGELSTLQEVAVDDVVQRRERLARSMGHYIFIPLAVGFDRAAYFSVFALHSKVGTAINSGQLGLRERNER